MTNKKQILSKLTTSLPVIAAPMFLISNPKTVIACCQNGVIGSFPALNQRTSDGFQEWLVEIKEALKDQDAAPYAVNLIVNPINTRLEDDLKLCIKHEVPIIITSLGINPDLIKAVQNYGGIVLHDVAQLRHAQKAADAGVDGIIAVCNGAGGHAGTLNPFAFIGEIRQFFDGVLILAGSLSKGSDILAAQIMGTDFAYMGTRFINTVESTATDEYKDMIIQAHASDITYTDAVSGIPANFLNQSLEQAGFDMNTLQGTEIDKGQIKGLVDEVKAWKTVWSAGHGVGNIQDICTTQDLIATLTNEYNLAKNVI